MYIKQKNTNTYVNLNGYVGELSAHPLIVDMSDKFEIVDTISENPDWMISNYTGDPRKAPDYYLVRESVGKALVNEVATELLLKYKSGELTLVQVMEIEQSLDNTMSALGRGQIISALFHISNVTGIDSTFKASIASRIQALKVAHYA